MIRWKRGDFIRLGKAVSEFNKEIAKNEQVIDSLALPEKVEYKNLRDSIMTREGLNYYIQSLKRIKLPGSFNVETLENGEKITTYAKREIERSRRSTEKILSNEIKSLESQTKVNLGIDADIKLPSAFKSLEQKRLEAKLRDFKDLYKLSGKEFRKRARDLGVYAKESKFRHAYIFRQNYMKVMREKYRSLENFNKFEAWARKHKDPINFYNSLPDGEFYPNDLTYQSDTTMQQEDFNSFLESLGIEIEQE